MSLETILSVMFGGLITWFAAWYYYVRAAKELKEETDRVKNLLRISVQAMEDAGMVTLNRNGFGEVVGMVHSISGTASIVTHAKAHLTTHNEAVEGDERE